MITLVRKAVGYILNSGEATETQSQLTDNRPRLEDFIPLDSGSSESQEFEGVVTFVNDNSIVINKDIYFEVQPQKCPRPFNVGDRVCGLAHRNMELEAWRASFVQHQREAWDSTGENSSSGSANFRKREGAVISCRELEAGIPGIFKQDLLSTRLKNTDMQNGSSCLQNGKDNATEKLAGDHSAVGKVTAIFGDSVTVNENLHFTVPLQGCNFQLMKGDWIIYKLDSNSAKEENGNQVSQTDPPVLSSVEPLRKKKIRGVVSWRYSTHAIINEEIFVPKSLLSSTVLQVGDSVSVEVIESEQEVFCWRAIAVFVTSNDLSNPQDSKDGSSSTLCNDYGFSSLSGGDKILHLLKDKNGIIISKVVKFPVVYLGMTCYTAAFIKNIGVGSQSLRRVYFVSISEDCQFSLDSSSAGGLVDSTPVMIQPDSGISIRFKCAAALLGMAKHLCIFDFGDFEIGRYITAIVGDEQMSTLLPSSPSSFHQNHRKHKEYQPSKGMVIPGTSPYKPPPFLPINLPVVPVPKYLWEATQEEEYILNVVPYLASPLTKDNHKEKLSILLHLEEIAMEQQMRQFDMVRSTFSNHGEYLSLSVPGLAEKRPSLMVGDTILVSTPDSNGNIFYEGYIHEVLHTQILLKFHPSFHQQYKGEDYAIQFRFNRTPLRRCHFALGFSMTQLGPDILFPSKLKLQLPQVSYVDPEVPTCVFQGQRKRSLCKIGQDPLPSKNKEVSIPNSHESFLSAAPAEERTNHLNRDSLQHTNSEGDDGNEDQSLASYGDDPDVVIEEADDEEENVLWDNKAPHMESNQKDAHTCESSSTTKTFRNGGSDIMCKNSIPQDLHKCLTKMSEVPITPEPKHLPPRIPVVTRLFGVPSPGSSSNSSKSFSDDEMRDHGDGWRNSQRFTKIENSECLPSQFACAQSWSAHKKQHICRIQDRAKKQSESCENEPYLIETISCQDENGIGQSEQSQVQFKPSEKLKVNQKLLLKGLEASSRHSQRRQRKKSQRTDSVASGERSSVGKHSQLAKQHLSCSVQRDLGPRKLVEKQTGFTPKDTNIGKENRYCIPVIPINTLNKKGRESLSSIPTLKWINVELNSEQKLAVRRILEGSTRPLPYVIFGPPGTGKTITLVEAALQVLEMVGHSRLLIVTPSNSASDLVTERILASGRVGKADLVRLNPFYRQEENVPDVIRPFCCNGDNLRFRVHQRIIITTATTSGLLYTLGLHNGHFSHVFVDEAGQLTEPECLLSIGLVNKVSGQIVLAGDPEQLGPVVQSRLAKKFGLGNSFLHRLCSSVLYQPQGDDDLSWVYEPHLVTQLVRNYRSHLDIIAVPSKLFYHESLQAFASQKKQKELLGWPELPSSSCPVLFHGLVSDNLQEGDSPSWFNPAEAFQVVRYAKSLLEFGVSGQNIGIITPYRKQVDKIRLLLTTFGVPEGIKVGSVEEFQGQERKAIIISTVRSSLELVEIDVQHSLGFVKCRRRFNVAVTRAQSLLVIVGNPLLLSQDECWRELISFCISRGVYRGPDLDSLFHQTR